MYTNSIGLFILITFRQYISVFTCTTPLVYSYITLEHVVQIPLLCTVSHWKIVHQVCVCVCVCVFVTGGLRAQWETQRGQELTLWWHMALLHYFHINHVHVHTHTRTHTHTHWLELVPVCCMLCVCVFFFFFYYFLPKKPHCDSMRYS